MNLNKIFKEERKIVFLVMIVYFLGVMVGVANAADKEDQAKEAFSELGLTGYDIISIERQHLMSAKVTLYITAVHKTGKKMHFVLKKQKSVFWERHHWRVHSSVEL